MSENLEGVHVDVEPDQGIVSVIKIRQDCPGVETLMIRFEVRRAVSQ